MHPQLIFNLIVYIRSISYDISIISNSMGDVILCICCVSQTGGPFWPVALGRRDGRTASESDANQQIPSPSETLANITSKFTSKGLTFKDLVVLSGLQIVARI